MDRLRVVRPDAITRCVGCGSKVYRPRHIGDDEDKRTGLLKNLVGQQKLRRAMFLDLQQLDADGSGDRGLHTTADSNLVRREGKGEQQHPRSLVELSKEVGEGSQTALLLVDRTSPSASLSGLQRDLSRLRVETDDLDLQ